MTTKPIPAVDRGILNVKPPSETAPMPFGFGKPYNEKRRLTADQVRDIRQGGEVKDHASRYDLSEGFIREIRRREAYKDVY